MRTISMCGMLLAAIVALGVSGCGKNDNGRSGGATKAKEPTGNSKIYEEMSRATVAQSSGPLTVEQARRQTAFSFPDSAKNIQFATYRQWVATLDFVRFEAPVSDCCDTARKIIASHNKKNPDRKVLGLRPLDRTNRNQPMAESNTSPLSAPWFDPQTIRKGLVAGETHSDTPSIWIDTQRGVFYYQYTD
ncbi:MAG: hypothetical protein ABFC96_04420 [Thermoguttaceae bacterium]